MKLTPDSPAPPPATADRPAAARMAGSSLLAAAFAVSLVLHAIVLSVRFVPPKAKPARDRSRDLEVVLVNARHARAPDNAQVYAQANLDGGGSSERENLRLKTPLPPQDSRRDGNALTEAKRRVEQLERTQQQLLTQNRKTAPAVTSAPAQPVKSQTQPQPAPSGVDLLDSAASAARLEAEISKNLEKYASRPRRTAMDSARAKEYRFAQYIEDWRLKVERIGTLNYPEAARGRIYGSLVLTVSIRSDGSVEKITVDRSSGHPVLDEAAVRIIRLSAPFASFPPDIRKDSDILDIPRTWTFTNSDQVRTDKAR